MQDDMEPTTFSQRLKFAREQAGLSVDQVSSRLSLWEEARGGDPEIAPSIITQLADIYGVSIEWLVSGRPSATAQEAWEHIQQQAGEKLSPEDSAKLQQLTLSIH